MRHTTDDLRIKEIRVLTPPAHLLHEFPCSETASGTVHRSREASHEILHGRDDRLMVIVGPCSIHDPKAALEYAQRLASIRRELRSELEIIMRVYFEKPRTTVGWKGLINDPDLDGSYRINHGLRVARELILDINNMEVPVGVEYLDMITPQYIADLVSWGAIGARTTESQVHRELASGLSCPIGFKNGTRGNVKIAVDAIGAAEHPHSFLSVTKGGISAIVETNGNDDCHIILRGGSEPNYDAENVAAAQALLRAAGHRENIMIDASHSNSRKVCRNQIDVIHNVCQQVADGNQAIIGVMIESNLVEGRQDIGDGKNLVYGQSITDACIGWDDTSTLLHDLARAVRDRRSRCM